jgi:hypothetical protein
MNGLLRILLVALGFGLLAVAIGFLTSTPAPAAPASVPVTVVNPASAPVPTAAQGTTNIAGNVGIVPDSGGNPLPLVVRDHTPTQPFHIMLCTDTGIVAGSCQTNFPPANSTVVVPYTTSDGQKIERMVIENITGSCESFGQQVFQLLLSTTLNENSPTATLYDTLPVSASASGLIQTTSQQTRLYAEPGSLLTLIMGVTGTAADGSFCGVILTGYMTTITP